MVSVIVPAHNALASLAETLSSAIAQGGEIEIAVVDDGSTDATLAIAQSFEPRVSVHTGPNRGVSEARNRGIRESHGEWLIFLDADDLLIAGTIEKRLYAAEETGADVVICDWEEFAKPGTCNGTQRRIRCIDWDAMDRNPELAIATHVWATTAAILYRRTLVEKIGGFREDLPVIQDARFLFDAAYHGARFVHADHVGARYRLVAGSLSRRNPRAFWIDVLRNGQQIESLWRERGAISERQVEALGSIYSGAANALARLGRKEAIVAAEAMRKNGKTCDLKLKTGLGLLRLAGADTTQMAFRFGGRAMKLLRGR